MWFKGMAVLASAAVLGACAGGEESEAATDAAAPAADAAAPVAAGAPAPITGTIHEVEMLGDAQGYRFEPAQLTIKQGDGVKFVMVSGPPHNVAFQPERIADNAEAQLAANMPNTVGPLTSPMFIDPNVEYTISFANVPPGQYPYVCIPHLAMNMVGTITVE